MTKSYLFNVHKGVLLLILCYIFYFNLSTVQAKFIEVTLNEKALQNVIPFFNYFGYVIIMSVIVVLLIHWFIIIEEKRVFEVIVISSIILVLSSIYIFNISSPSNHIFPLWLLNSNDPSLESNIDFKLSKKIEIHDHHIPNSKENITIGDEFYMNVGTQNLMAETKKCRIYLKFRNSSQQLPNSSHITPSSINPLLHYQFTLENEEQWNIKIKVRAYNSTNELENKSNLIILEIDDIKFDTGLRLSKDPNLNIYQIFLELWIYDEKINEYVFTGIWVSSKFLNYK